MEYKAFKDLTKEERSEIVEAKLRGEVEELDITGCWQSAKEFRVNFSATYRIKPVKKLDIPWEIIKHKYKWVAMDSDGDLFVATCKPVLHAEFGWTGCGGIDALDALNIDTAGISWENSLTQRPEGV